MHAAEAGNEPAVSLMLDLGFPIDVRRDDGATALHAAAYAGSAPVVRLLLDRGADPEAPDGQWESPALEWAVIGSGFRPKTSPHPDWITTVRVLIEAGASTQGLSLSPDAQKPPSPEVAELLRTYGVGTTDPGALLSDGRRRGLGGLAHPEHEHDQQQRDRIEHRGHRERAGHPVDDELVRHPRRAPSGPVPGRHDRTR